MAEEKRFYFAKIPAEYILRNVDLMHLRRAENGAVKVLVYHKLIAESLENEGNIYFADSVENFAEDFGMLYHEDGAEVLKTIELAAKEGLIEFQMDHIFMTQVPSLVGSETAAAGRMRKLRLKQKQNQKSENRNNVTVERNNVTEERNNVTEERNNVQNGYGEVTEECNNVRESYDDVTEPLRGTEQSSKSLLYIDIDIDKDIDIEKETYIGQNEQSKQSVTRIADHVSPQQVVDLYHEKCPSLPRVIKLTPNRVAIIKRILKKYTLDDLAKVYEIAEKSDFLKGNSNSPGHEHFKADFDFFLNETKIIRTLEGRYGGTGDGKNQAEQKLIDECESLRRWAEDGSGS